MRRLDRLRHNGHGASVGPADAIDPAYGEALRAAAARGVELLAVRARVTPEAIALAETLPVMLD